MMYQRILLAVDGSKHSERATEQAVAIASLTEGSLIEVVLVADFSKAKNEVLHSQGKEELEVARRKKLINIEKIIQEKNVSYEVNILHGEPGPTIVSHGQ